MLHDPTAGKQKRLEAWKVLIEKRDAGVLQSIGVSNFVSPALVLARTRLDVPRLTNGLWYRQGVEHLKQIKEAGLETPEVRLLTSEEVRTTLR